MRTLVSLSLRAAISTGLTLPPLGDLPLVSRSQTPEDCLLTPSTLNDPF